MKRTLSLIAPMALVALVGCGGSTTAPAPTPATPTPASATSFAYTDPTTTASDWKLLKDATSTDTKLVLNLVGPSNGTKYRGAGFTLKYDPTQIKVARFKDAEGKPLAYHKDGGVFKDIEVTYDPDGNKVFTPVPTLLQISGVRDGKLMVGIFQNKDDCLYEAFSGGEGMGSPARDCSTTLLQVTLELDSALKALPGAAPLTVLKARSVPEIVIKAVKDSYIYDVTDRHVIDIPLKVGTLTLK